MKTVHTKQDVAHLFANRLQSEARNAGRNFYFYNDTIFSYGGHFPMAKHIKNKKGEKALLFTTRTYSKTTAKHLSILRSATNHLNILFCFNPNFEPQRNIEEAEREIKNVLTGLEKARKPEKYILEAEQIQTRVKKYADFFGLKTKSIDKLIESAKGGKYAEMLKKERKAKERREEKERKEAQIKFLETLNKWRAFEIGTIYGRPFDCDFLRFNKETKRIETSQGVEIPEEIGKRAFDWIIKTEICAGDCNYKVLDYEVKELNANFVRIGCHKIEIEEVKQLAKQLNWIK